MKRAILCAAFLALGLPAFAEDKPGDYTTGQVTIGANQTDSDTLSSKFLEYRDIPEGAVVPFFRFRGKKGDFRYDVRGSSTHQRDEQFTLRLENKVLRVDGDYNRIPHAFGNNGHSLLTATSEGVYQMSDTLQKGFQDAILAAKTVNYSFLSALVAPSLATAQGVDLDLTRERGNLSLRLTPENKPLDVRFTYYHERRVGDRAAGGTAFGFGNVVETPEPTHYLTQDYGVSAEYSGSWGVARAGFHFNDFKDRLQAEIWDNPFRATDATSASAYTAPSSTAKEGASFGRMALPPSNQAVSGNAGVVLKFGTKTRLTGDVALSQWTQNETPFIPFTTNTAIATFALPADKLDGKMNTTSVSAAFLTRPADHFSINLRYRRYDVANKTPRLSFVNGYVRFDAVLEDIPRISVPYGFTNDRFDATADYDFGKLTLEGGYTYYAVDRTFRETDKTKDNTVRLAVNVRGADWATLRASYEHGSRDFDGLEIERSEEASYLEPGAAGNLLAAEPALVCASGVVCNLRYDQARKKTDRVGASAELSPGSGKATFMLSYYHTKDNYDETTFGLIDTQYDTFTAEVDYTASERATVYGFYSYEKLGDFQRGRQSGATLSLNPLDDWTSDKTDKVNSFGLGATFNLVPEKWDLNLASQYQKVDGNNTLFSPPGGTPNTAASIPLFDDTKIFTLSGELKYRFSKAWDFGVGGLFEDYTIHDSQTDGIINYMPGSFFLAADNGGYQAKVGYLRLTYRW